MAKQVILISVMVLISCYLAFASDPKSLQDFCVADLSSSAKVNGHACKDPKYVGADDFYFSGMHIPANTSNPDGFKVTLVSVAQLPGLNTLGISMARLDYAPYGVNPPHTHPRATEIFLVLEGCIEVGFVTSNPENRLIRKVLYQGDVFVFPVGLAHYQWNPKNEHAVALVGLSSQTPGTIGMRNAVFASSPKINNDILAKAFQIDTTLVDQIQYNL